MVSPSVFDHLGSVWAHLEPFGPFQTKNVFLLLNTSAKPYFVDLGQKNHFCLKWPKKGSQMVKNTWVDYLGHFWNQLDHFEALKRGDKAVALRASQLQG